MTKAIRVKMDASFLLRTYCSDWRDDANLEAVVRVLEAMFEEADVSVEGHEVGPCTCPISGEDFFTTGSPGETDSHCPWHGDEAR